MSAPLLPHDPSQPLPVEAEQLWEVNSAWWQESFTEGADPEYREQIVPLLVELLSEAAPVTVLDIGCGEGQLSRVAAGLPGVRLVTGVDPTSSQLVEAARRGHNRPARDDGRSQGATGPAGVHYVRATATALPFPDESFDAAFACLVFEHIEGTVDAIAEVGRVLRPGATFVLFLNHPLLQVPGSGWVDDDILGEQYWRIGPYLTRTTPSRRSTRTSGSPSCTARFRCTSTPWWPPACTSRKWSSRAPPAGFLAKAEEYRQAAAFPRLLVLRAEKLNRPKVNA